MSNSDQDTIPQQPGILLVEDDAATAEEVARHLRIDGGFQVYRATTVQEARSLALQYPTLRFIVLDMRVPNEEAPGDYNLSGVLLLREFSEILSKAKIYIKSQTRLSLEASEFVRSHRSVVRIESGYDPPDIVRRAKIVYSDGQMQPSVFIVHGHDADALDLLINVVRDELRLGEPIVIKNELEGGRTVIEKFEDYAQKADLVLALLTPDDLSDSVRRARQNVIFEIGYFAAALGRKSGLLLLLTKGGVEIPSDMKGMLTIDITGGTRVAAEAIRKQLKGWWGMSLNEAKT